MKKIDYILCILGLLLITELAMSISWRFLHDTALYQYVGYMMTQGYVLGKDLYVMSLPGTFLFHYWIIKLFGTSDLAFRVVDLVHFSLLSFITFNIMKRFDLRAAFGSVIIFGLTYLHAGAITSLQKDYVPILLISMAVLITLEEYFSSGIRTFLIGLLFGMVVLVKPPLGIGLIPILYYIWHKERKLSTLLPVCSILIPPIICGIWLWKLGGLTQYIEMVTNYLPLYMHLTKHIEFLFGIDRILYLIKSFIEFGGLHLWLIPATYGIWKTKSKEKLLLGGLAICYAIYPLVQGQFFWYHWLPLLYFMALLSSLSLSKPYAPIMLVIILLAIPITLPTEIQNQLKGEPAINPYAGRVDDIGKYLSEHLQEGDTVQPLDWVAGSIHGMLLAEAKIATPYIYDHWFYHHISHPFIKTLRGRFIQDLKEANPRYIIRVSGSNKPWPTGVNTTEKFEELEEILNSYERVHRGEWYYIYELRNDTELTNGVFNNNTSLN